MRWGRRAAVSMTGMKDVVLGRQMASGLLLCENTAKTVH